MSIVLFQCARELVYNAAKHARLRRPARSNSKTEKQHVLLTVSDDGRGFDNAASRSPVSGGFGLFSMRERLALFGGELSIESTAAGTRATVRMPLGRSKERQGDRAGSAARLHEPGSNPATP